MKIRLLLADDHSLFRAGLRSLLEGQGNFDIVGEASNGKEAVAVVEKVQPDVVLTDLAMPEMNGLDATAHIKARYPQVHVVVLSITCTKEHVQQALRAGAAGFLLKNASPAELTAAVETVMRGEIYLHPAVSQFMVADFLTPASKDADLLESLTPRQREVLQMIAEGNSTKDMARKLHLSVKTVEMHRSRLMNALDIHDIAGLVRFAIRMKIVAAT